jgi:hypothetical protein
MRALFSPATALCTAAVLVTGCTSHHAIAGAHRHYYRHHYRSGDQTGGTAGPIPSRSPGSCHATSTDPATTRPDPHCTPGAIDPKITQADIHSTICVSGFTSTIRPPASYTGELKRAQIRWYGYSDTRTGDYEEDHFIPLSLGGAPSDPANLWPETGHTVNPKDDVEFSLYRAVCDGRTTLDAARHAIATDWTTALARLHLPLLHSASGG